MGNRSGQNFLINKSKARKIVDALDLKPGDTILEIGPGHGELTEIIRHQAPSVKIIAIEKDGKLADLLKEKFSKDRNLEIIAGDVLKILKPRVSNFKSYKIVGNIPYYITGYLLRIIGELENKPSLIVLTVQKEVAERTCAYSGMNLLAASVQFWAEPKIVGYISKKDFRPIPKVDSAIIKLSPRTDAELTQTDAEEYYKFIKVLFRQPRKKIINNLAATGAGKEEIAKKLEKAGVDPNDRPQNLNIKQIFKLCTLF